MKNLIIIKAVTLFGLILATALLSSCGSAKYVKCDAYKTQYKPIKAERHHGHHIKCDAYN